MKARGDADFSHAMTDLMSGVAVTFLLIAAIFMVHSAHDRRQALAAEARAKHAAEQNKVGAEELEQLKVVDRRGIDALVALKTKLEPLRGRIELDYNPVLDPRLLTIVFSRENLRFDSAACEISAGRREALVATLRELLPLVCATVATRLVQSITLEGHTDNESSFGGRCGTHTPDRSCYSDPSQPACINQSFENNVTLSSARAHFVFFQARKALQGDREIADCLEHNFVVAGRGPVEPLDGLAWATRRDPAENERNRRVVVKVRVQTAAVNP